MKNKKTNSRILLIGIITFTLGVVLVFMTGGSPIKTTQKSDKLSSVTVYNCGEEITFDAIPQRVLSFDTNMTEIMLKLGLKDHMTGYWISGVEVGEEFKEDIGEIPLISTITWPPPSLETIVSLDPDFVFGAWDYNFSNESGVTPEKLKEYGIKSYVLTESCIAIGVKPNEGIESTYDDIENLGKIFHVEEKAKEVIDSMKSNISKIQEATKDISPKPRGFYYGGGADAAFTAGKYAMVTKMMNAVGAENILGDTEDDWIPAAGWETIIERA